MPRKGEIGNAVNVSIAMHAISARVPQDFFGGEMDFGVATQPKRQNTEVGSPAASADQIETYVGDE
jgi:hypothetical protein